MILDALRAALQFAFLLACNLVLDLLGLVVVAIAIPFRKPELSVSDGRPIVNLPRWAWIWGNDYDGLLGDKRGWWAANTPFGVPVDSFLAMWWWAAVRNPSNNTRRVSLFSCPVSECQVSYVGAPYVRDKIGSEGWQFVICKRGWRRWYCFYWVHPWNESNALVIRLGFKVNPTDYAGDVDVGEVVKINPYKDIS